MWGLIGRLITMACCFYLFGPFHGIVILILLQIADGLQEEYSQL